MGLRGIIVWPAEKSTLEQQLLRDVFRGINFIVAYETALIENHSGDVHSGVGPFCTLRGLLGQQTIQRLHLNLRRLAPAISLFRV